MNFLKRFGLLLCLTFSFSVFAEEEVDVTNLAEDAVSVDVVESCELAMLDKAIRPLNPTICPMDTAVVVAFKNFPNLMEKAVKVAGLDYQEEIIANSKIYVNSNVSGKFEQISNVLMEMVFLFVKMVIAFQLALAGWRSMQEGVLLGKEWGNVKTLFALGTGVVLIIPTGDNIYLVQLLFGILYLLSVALCNLAVSTVLYFITLTLVDPEIVNPESASQEVVIDSSIGSLARYDIETNLCTMQSSAAILLSKNSLLGGGLSGVVDRYGMSDYGVSSKKGGKNTVIEHSETVGFTSSTSQFPSKQTTLHYGVGIDGELSTVQLNCGSKTVTLNPPVLLEEYVTDTVELDDINKAIDKASLSDLVGEGTLEELSESAATSIIEKNEAKLVDGDTLSPDSKMEIKKSVAEYVFNSALYKIYLGTSFKKMESPVDMLNGVLGTPKTNIDNEFSRLHSQRAKYAAEASKALIGQRCYEVWSKYKEARQTVDSFFWNNEPNLSCVVVAPDEGLTVAFDASTSNYNEFRVGVEALRTSDSEKAEANFLSIVKSYEENEGVITERYGKLIDKIEDSRILEEDNFSIIREIRRGGFGMMGSRFIEIMKWGEGDTILTYSDKKNLMGHIEHFTTYSRDGTFLSDNLNEEQSSALQEPNVVIPSYIYRQRLDESNAINVAKIDETVSSILSSNSGGNLSGSAQLEVAANDSSVSSMEDQGEYIRDKTTALFSLIYSDPSTHLGLENAELDCTSRDRDTLRCERVNNHPISYYQKVGGYAMDIGVLGIVVSKVVYYLDTSTASNPLGILAKTVQKSTSTGAAQPFFSSGILMFAEMAPLFLMLIALGGALSYILPLFPFVMFCMSFVAWVIYSFHVFIVSPLLVAGLFVFMGSNESGFKAQRAFMMVSVNVVLKPLLFLMSHLIAWALLSAALVGLDHFLSSLVTEYTSGDASGPIASSVMAFMVALAIISVSAWVFSKANEMTKLMIDRLGADAIDSREQEVASVLADSLKMAVSIKAMEALKSKAGSAPDTSHRGAWANKINEYKEKFTNSNAGGEYDGADVTAAKEAESKLDNQKADELNESERYQDAEDLEEFMKDYTAKNDAQNNGDNMGDSGESGDYEAINNGEPPESSPEDNPSDKDTPPDSQDGENNNDNK